MRIFQFWCPDKLKPNRAGKRHTKLVYFNLLTLMALQSVILLAPHKMIIRKNINAPETNIVETKTHPFVTQYERNEEMCR